jgi:hypothetical protein
MTARRRKTGETYKQYRKELKMEAAVEWRRGLRAKGWVVRLAPNRVAGNVLPPRLEGKA